VNIRTTAGHLTAHDKRVIAAILEAGGKGATTPRKVFSIEGADVWITETVTEWSGPTKRTHKASFEVKGAAQ
jgi:hypothetical protein